LFFGERPGKAGNTEAMQWFVTTPDIRKTRPRAGDDIKNSSMSPEFVLDRELPDCITCPPSCSDRGSGVSQRFLISAIIF